MGVTSVPTQAHVRSESLLRPARNLVENPVRNLVENPVLFRVFPPSQAFLRVMFLPGSVPNQVRSQALSLALNPVFSRVVIPVLVPNQARNPAVNQAPSPLEHPWKSTSLSSRLELVRVRTRVRTSRPALATRLVPSNSSLPERDHQSRLNCLAQRARSLVL